MRQEYDRLVARLANIFDVPERHLRQRLQASVAPGSTPLAHAKALLRNIQRSSPRRLANICRKNGCGNGIDYERLLITAEKVRRAARREKPREVRP